MIKKQLREYLAEYPGDLARLFNSAIEFDELFHEYSDLIFSYSPGRLLIFWSSLKSDNVLKIMEREPSFIRALLHAYNSPREGARHAYFYHSFVGEVREAIQLGKVDAIWLSYVREYWELSGGDTLILSRIGTDD